MNESVRNGGNPLGARDSNVNAAKLTFGQTYCPSVMRRMNCLLRCMGLCTSDSIAAHLLEVSLPLKGGNSASGRKKPAGSLGSVRSRLHIQRKTNHAVWMRLPCRSRLSSLSPATRSWSSCVLLIT
jgi:hypothetical protein